MVGVIKEQGAVAGVWVFLQHLPFGIGAILIPIVMLTLVLSFSTAADSMTSTVAALCVKGEGINAEAPGYLKIAWGLLIGSISVILGAYAGGVRGIDGVRQLAAVGGFLVLFVYILQMASFTKVFFAQNPFDE
jgi:choline-glycine betaine transporter